MNDRNKWTRHVDHAVEKELHSLAQRKDDGQTAINQYTQIGCRLVELGLSALSEVPGVDLTEADGAFLAVRATVDERLPGLNTLRDEPRRTVHGLRLGPLTVMVSTEHTDSADPEEHAWRWSWSAEDPSHPSPLLFPQVRAPGCPSHWAARRDGLS